jgi:hypothetical protein
VVGLAGIAGAVRQARGHGPLRARGEPPGRRA